MAEVAGRVVLSATGRAVDYLVLLVCWMRMLCVGLVMVMNPFFFFMFFFRTMDYLKNELEYPYCYKSQSYVKEYLHGQWVVLFRPYNDLRVYFPHLYFDMVLLLIRCSCHNHIFRNQLDGLLFAYLE